MKKSVDSTFLHYGVRQEDMQVIVKACQDSGIDAKWMKQSILKPYHEERNNQNFVDDKRINKILRSIKGCHPSVDSTPHSVTKRFL